MKYVIEIYHREHGQFRQEYDTRYDAALDLDRVRARYLETDGWVIECRLEVLRRYTFLEAQETRYSAQDVFKRLFDMHMEYSESRVK